MAATAQKRMRKIQRLARIDPRNTLAKRLEQIAGLASGELEPSDIRPRTDPTLSARIKEGQASRSIRNAADKRPPRSQEKPEDDESEEKKKRGRRGGRDRKEAGGFDRSEDLNP